ncbi:transposase [Betaproteobacteria bacterium]|nr:transposase [Betaproteobacteria bacterium]
MNTTHDTHYRLLFSHPTAIRDLLTGFAPGPWEHADFSTLERVNASYISDSEKARHGDTVWRLKVGGEWLWVYIMLELQSTPDRWMALRMLNYTALLLQDLVRQHGKDFPADRLPPILPLVLYNGTPPWRATTEVADFCRHWPESLAAYRPQLKYHLIDEQRLNLHPVAEVRNFTAAIFALENSRSNQDVITLLHTLGKLLAAPEMQALRQTMHDWLQTSLQGRAPASTIEHIHDILEGEDMLADRVEGWFKQAKQQGWNEGLLAGEQKGLLEGRNEGLLAGAQKGLLEGEAKVLARQLARRFGPLPKWAAARVQEADAEQLETWADAVLEATTLGEVFGSTGLEQDED